MDFYREKIIKNPTKKYRCELCCAKIEGEHYYISGRGYDFFTYRAHTECYDKAKKMCGECRDSYNCDASITECYQHKVLFKED